MGDGARSLGPLEKTRAFGMTPSVTKGLWLWMALLSAREIPRPAGESAGLRNDASLRMTPLVSLRGYVPSADLDGGLRVSQIGGAVGGGHFTFFSRQQ